MSQETTSPSFWRHGNSSSSVPAENPFLGFPLFSPESEVNPFLDTFHGTDSRHNHPSTLSQRHSFLPDHQSYPGSSRMSSRLPPIPSLSRQPVIDLTGDDSPSPVNQQSHNTQVSPIQLAWPSLRLSGPRNHEVIDLDEDDDTPQIVGESQRSQPQRTSRPDLEVTGARTLRPSDHTGAARLPTPAQPIEPSQFYNSDYRPSRDTRTATSNRSTGPRPTRVPLDSNGLPQFQAPRTAHSRRTVQSGSRTQSHHSQTFMNEARAQMAQHMEMHLRTMHGVTANRRQLREALVTSLNYRRANGHIGLSPALPARQPYDQPPAPQEGFTRSPTDEMTLVCPNCDEELVAAGEPGTEKRQVFVAKSCGHVSIASSLCLHVIRV
jgi:hypothetical protein